MLAAGTDCLKKIGLIALVALAVLVAVFWQEIPAWRSGGTIALAMPTVGGDDAASLCPSPGGTIELRGDSHVAGARMEDKAPAYPQVMQDQLGPRIRILAQGIGGFTAQMAERHWLARGVQGEAVLLAFGTNDAAPRGWIGGKQSVPIESFKASLVRQIESLRHQGARVGLIAPPPAGSPAMNHRLAPYRAAVAEVGKATGVPVFDPAESLAGCERGHPMLVRDALHLNAAGHRCIGTWLARRICKP